MGQIKAIITDFDGTLIDTYSANVRAYKDTFAELGYNFDGEKYGKAFGYRLDDMLKYLNIPLYKKNEIKELKRKYYKNYYGDTYINEALLGFIQYMRRNGVKTCIASTASKENIIGLLDFYGIRDIFDFIISGEDVQNGKPAPDVYNRALDICDVPRDEAIVFEDSNIGFEAAKNAGINFVNIKTF